LDTDNQIGEGALIYGLHGGKHLPALGIPLVAAAQPALKSSRYFSTRHADSAASPGALNFALPRAAKP